MSRMQENHHERPCPVCQSRLTAPFADEHIDPEKINEFTYASRKQPEFMCLRLVRCLNCDLVYAPSPPASEQLSAAYAEADFDSAPEATAAARSYARELSSFIGKIEKRTAAVDVGAGSGPLLPWLVEQGFHPVIGIEPSGAAIKAAPSHVQAMLREGMFSRQMLADVKPALLCSFMTLEHMAKPEEFVASAYEVLEPGGMLAVVVHNWRAPLNRLLGLRSPIIDLEHLQLFSPESLRTLLARSGFKSIELRAIRNTYPLRYWLRLTPLPAQLKSGLLKIFESLGLADMNCSFKVGNLLAVGTKPANDEKAPAALA